MTLEAAHAAPSVASARRPHPANLEGLQADRHQAVTKALHAAAGHGRNLVADDFVGGGKDSGHTSYALELEQELLYSTFPIVCAVRSVPHPAPQPAATDFAHMMRKLTPPPSERQPSNFGQQPRDFSNSGPISDAATENINYTNANYHLPLLPSTAALPNIFTECDPTNGGAPYEARATRNTYGSVRPLGDVGRLLSLPSFDLAPLNQKKLQSPNFRKPAQIACKTDPTTNPTSFPPAPPNGTLRGGNSGNGSRATLGRGENGKHLYLEQPVQLEQSVEERPSVVHSQNNVMMYEPRQPQRSQQQSPTSEYMWHAADKPSMAAHHRINDAFLR